MTESSPPGTPVLRLTATDLDTSHNALVRYVIVPRDRDAASFEIDAQSGQITTARGLDREENDRLSFIVSDGPHISYREFIGFNSLTKGVNSTVRVSYLTADSIRLLSVCNVSRLVESSWRAEDTGT